VSVSKTSRGEALQFSQQFEIETFNEFTANAFEIIGRNSWRLLKASLRVLSLRELSMIATPLAPAWMRYFCSSHDG